MKDVLAFSFNLLSQNAVLKPDLYVRISSDGTVNHAYAILSKLEKFLVEQSSQLAITKVRHFAPTLTGATNCLAVCYEF